MSSSADLAAILETDTLTYIRVLGIFLVFSVALYNFLENGKMFSLISLLIALILGITITVYYFVEKNRIANLGFYTKVPITILMYVMIGVIIFNIWLIYEVWHSQPISLVKVAEDIETEVKQANIQDIANQIEKQVEISNLQNQMLLKYLASHNGKGAAVAADFTKELEKINQLNASIPSKVPSSPNVTGPLLQAPSLANNLRNIENIRHNINTAVLASIA